MSSSRIAAAPPYLLNHSRNASMEISSPAASLAGGKPSLPSGSIATTHRKNAKGGRVTVSSKRNHRGLGWALRACDGARADELSKYYRALRT